MADVSHVGLVVLEQLMHSFKCSELPVFESKGALDRFKASQLSLAADASAVVLKTGVATDISFIDGVAVVVSPIGGAMVEAAIYGGTADAVHA
jgi:hypothetical protein